MSTAVRPTVCCRFLLSSEKNQIQVRFTATGMREETEVRNGTPNAPTPEAERTFSGVGSFEADLESPRLSRLLARIKTTGLTQEDLRDVGVQLWTGLLSNEVAQQLAAARDYWKKAFYQIRLSVPQELGALPWETIYDERIGFLSEAPDHCVIHHPPPEIPEPTLEAHRGGHLRLLLVIPEGSGLNIGVEFRAIEHEVRRAVGPAAQITRLDGRVPPGRLAEALKEERDVVHFIGHGGVGASGQVLLRFNSDDASAGEQDVPIERFAAMFRGRGVRLVVLNSCLGASGFSQKSLSGAGPHLMRAGVPAVVAMRYEIDDRDAIRFSTEFYRELVKTERVDLAMQWARQQVSLNSTLDRAQAFIAPVLYLVEGTRPLFNLARDPAPGAAATRPQVQIQPPPPELLDALREGRCIPIIGPELLREEVKRNQHAPPGPKELADILKRAHGYPDEDDFRESDSVGWLDDLLLQRVCQYSYSSMGGRFWQVLGTIGRAYRQCPPPRSFGCIAEWKVPGIVCTYFDGLMLNALNDRGKSLRVLNRVDEQVPIDDEHPLLLNLRGSVADTESLVLTEEDHEALWDRMMNLSPAVSNLLQKGNGRTLLLCGVSPRDVTVRRFLRRLLPHGLLRTQGGIFWVRPKRSKGDDGYWATQYRVEWIDEPLTPFLEELNSLLTARDAV